MPIEIRELVIRATVDPQGAGGSSGSGCGGGGARPPASQSSRRDAQSDENIVQRCVREVLRVLEDRQER